MKYTAANLRRQEFLASLTFHVIHLFTQSVKFDVLSQNGREKKPRYPKKSLSVAKQCAL